MSSALYAPSTSIERLIPSNRLSSILLQRSSSLSEHAQTTDRLWDFTFSVSFCSFPTESEASFNSSDRSLFKLVILCSCISILFCFSAMSWSFALIVAEFSFSFSATSLAKLANKSTASLVDSLHWIWRSCNCFLSSSTINS